MELIKRSDTDILTRLRGYNPPDRTIEPQTQIAWDIQDALAEIERLRFAKRPVAWRVKDFADGWVIFQDEVDANYEAEQTGAMVQGLYVRDGT